MLEAKNIDKIIEGNKVLNSISIEVEPSKITCLIGPSGGGKSTILSCLSLISQPTSGSINLDGFEFSFNGTKQSEGLFPYPLVTVVFQNLFLFPHLTNEENLKLPLKELKRLNPDYDSLIDRLMIRGVLHKYPNECSGGEKQRVALARQILLEPKYLLLDEITSALDIETVNVVANILLELKAKGTGILLITHMMNLARKISDNFYFLDKGSIVESGSVALLGSPRTERLRRFLEIYN